MEIRWMGMEEEESGSLVGGGRERFARAPEIPARGIEFKKVEASQ